MAEGDTIARLARRLDGELAGRRVTGSRFAVARLATADLSGREVLGVGSYGKHLLVRLGARVDRRAAVGRPTRRGDGPVTLHLHLRMDGALRVQARGPAVSHDIRFVLDLHDEARGAAVLVGERVPIVEVVPTATEGLIVGHLGPDLCAPGWSDASADEAVRRLGSVPGRPIVEALLDQRNLAGIGNLYAVEGCYLSGLWPWIPVGDLTGRLYAVVDLEHRLLAAGVAGSGQATTGDRRRGHAHWVYGRKDRPCRRCGVRVGFTPGDGGPATRATWWCPTCQPAPPGVRPPGPLPAPGSRGVNAARR